MPEHTWHKERRDAQLLHMRQYRAKNLDKIKSYERAYYDKNTERILRRETERRRSNPGRHMRITPEQYWALRKSQGDACAICERPFSELKLNPHIDHDHTCCPGRNGCGECVRGLLCPSCNRLMTIYDNGMWERVFDYQRAYESRVSKEQKHA